MITGGKGLNLKMCLAVCNMLETYPNTGLVYISNNSYFGKKSLIVSRDFNIANPLSGFGYPRLVNQMYSLLSSSP